MPRFGRARFAFIALLFALIAMSAVSSDRSPEPDPSAAFLATFVKGGPPGEIIRFAKQ
jgi:hypothetical protein